MAGYYINYTYHFRAVGVTSMVKTFYFFELGLEYEPAGLCSNQNSKKQSKA